MSSFETKESRGQVDFHSYYKIDHLEWFPDLSRFSASPKINFEFSFITTDSAWESGHQNSWIPLCPEQERTTPANFSVPLPLFCCYSKAHDFIKQNLPRLPFPDHVFDNLIDNAHWKAKKALESMPPGTDISVECRLHARNCTIFRRTTDDGIEDMVSLDDESICSSGDDESICPSGDDESIGSSGDSCCICLEEFCELGAASLPCGHAFHHYCITKWLTDSHSCPLCRFQLLAME